MALPIYLGPILCWCGDKADQYRLDALVVANAQSEPPSLCPMDGQLVTPFELLSARDRQAFYRLGDARHEVAGDLTGNVRAAYVSCNGQEHEDTSVSTEERNRMWPRLSQEHARAPFSLMLHGGDQLYADQVVKATRPLPAGQAPISTTRRAMRSRARCARRRNDTCFSAVPTFQASRPNCTTAQSAS